jgi:hypothetical protein
METERKPDEDEARLPPDFMGGETPLFDWEPDSPRVPPAAPEKADASGDPQPEGGAERPYWSRLTQLFG